MPPWTLRLIKKAWLTFQIGIKARPCCEYRQVATKFYRHIFFIHILIIQADHPHELFLARKQEGNYHTEDYQNPLANYGKEYSKKTSGKQVTYITILLRFFVL